VIIWSGPATAMGGLLFSLHSSKDIYFLQEKNIPTHAILGSEKKGIFFS
jgi:hypothetical protein